jgi:hypothetical protein
MMYVEPTKFTDPRHRVIAVGLETGCPPWLIEERVGFKSCLCED